MAWASNARSACLSNAVTNTTAGMRVAPTASITAKPSSSGICTSRKTRSGESAPIAATAAVPVRHDPDMPCAGPRGNAVAERVLDERLQDQRWNPRCERGVTHEDSVAQAPAEACLLDLEIAFEKPDFLAERHLIGFAAVQR